MFRWLVTRRSVVMVGRYLCGNDFVTVSIHLGVCTGGMVDVVEEEG